MTAQHLATTGQAFTGLYKHNQGVETFQLQVGDVRPLERQSQVLRVVSGHAWITMDGKDIVLKRGDELTLNQGTHPAVISAAGLRPVVVEVR